jgi:hypothetical protein
MRGPAGVSALDDLPAACTVAELHRRAAARVGAAAGAALAVGFPPRALGPQDGALSLVRAIIVAPNIYG